MVSDPRPASVLRLTLDAADALRILAIGAHPDDIEIGCGGTLLRLAREGRIAGVTWAVLSGTGVRRAEAEAGARAVLGGVPEVEIRLEQFRDGFFPARYEPIKDMMETLVAARPDVVLVPRRDDAHQDHRLLGELAWTVFRNHLILEYEIPKYDGDLRMPNLYVELPTWAADRKVEILLETFASQHDRSWFSADTFRGLLRLRGIEARASSGCAEGFVCRKVVL
jgi:LmbE family N-acetylglucosaminyl deacetylase